MKKLVSTQQSFSRLGIGQTLRDLPNTSSLLKKLFLFAVAIVFVGIVRGQDTVYQCDFDHPDDTSGWMFAGNRYRHYWVLGTATNMSSAGLFVTYDGSHNDYYLYGSPCVSYVYRRLVLPRGAYRFSYDWRCNGRRDGDTAYDYMRVLLVPGVMTPIENQVPDGMGVRSDRELPAGYIALDDNTPQCGEREWVSHSYDCFVEDSGVYTLVFMWYCSMLQWDHPAAVDNLVVSRPLCPQPMRLFVSPLGPTALRVNWRDYSEGNASDWHVELCTATVPFGHGATQVVQDTSAEFTGLTPNTDYWVYVSTLCGADSTTPVVVHVHTPCVGLGSLPYIQDFDSVAVGTLPPCWRVLRTGGNADVRSVDGGKVLRWRIAQSGYCCLVLPSVDESATPSGNIQLSFRCSRESSYLPFSHEFLVGLLPNASDVGSFVPVSRVVVNSDEWERCVVEMDGYGGENIALLDMGNDWVNGYVRFDDFVITHQTACQRVEHLTVSQANAAGARVEWSLQHGTVHEPSGYDVWVEQVDTMETNPSGPDSASLHFSSTEPHCTVWGLQPLTTYRAWVRAQCDNSAYSEWEGVVFTTLPLPCVVGDSTTADTSALGTGSSRTTGVPVSNIYVHSLCQSIYTADELHAAGVEAGLITGIDYTFSNNPHNMTVSLFVSTTRDSLYASTEDLLEVTSADRVYGPALYAAGNSGTVHFELDRPFSWNGVDNLVVTSFINNSLGALQSSSFFGNSTQVVGNRTVRSYLIEEPFTTANAQTGTAHLSNYRPSLIFHTMGCAELATCALPSVTVQGVGEDYAVVDWVPGYRDSVWSVYYREAADSVWTLADSHVVANHYQLMLLDANTDYRVGVVPHCGGDSLYSIASFTTLCASVYELPLFEDFEDFYAECGRSEAFEPCWYRGIPQPSYTNNYYPHITTNNGAYSGIHKLSLEHSWSDFWPVYFATPAMAMDVSSLQVSFFAKGLVSYRLKVGVMTDPTDFSTFEEVACVTPMRLNQWEQKEVLMDSYEGEGRYIALMLGNDFVDIDDLLIDYIQTCPRPSNLTFGIITHTTAEVQWDGGEAGQYELEYGPAGFALGSGTRLACNADTVTLRGLNHSTDYDVYVRGFCGDDTSRWSFVATFSTQCGEIDSLPYTQNFEELDGLPYPKCWVCGNASVVSYMPMGALSRGRALYLNNAYAILPGVDASVAAIQTLQLVVKASSDTNYGEIFSHELIVGVCSTEGDFTTFNSLDTITLTPTPTVYEVPLTGAAGRGRYITLRSTHWGRSLNNRVYIDSLAVELIPTCARPHRLTVTNLTTTSATIAWSGGSGATSWQVEYMPHGGALGSGVSQTTSTNSLTITGLTPATTYDYYVRSICGESDTSEWCHTPGLIVTQQIPASVPYQYGFDTVAEWNNWQTLSNCAATWCRGADDGQPAPSIYLSIDSGATRGILSNTVINSAVYRDFDFGNRDTSYVVSFSASEGGNPTGGIDYDGLAVFLVEPVAIPNIPSNYANESPWGSLGDLTLLANIRDLRSWRDYHFTIDSLRGVWRLVFYWYGRAGIYTTPGAVDNVSIQYETCQHPYNVQATAVTSGAATIAWHGPVVADYQVMLYNTDMFLLANDTVHTNSMQYNALLPGTTYRVRVRKLCDTVSSMVSPLLTFSTNACIGGTSDLVDGSWRGSTYYLPVCNAYRYSYTQQIVLASELSGEGDISSISFLYNSPVRMSSKNNCTIYMGHTTLSSFTSLSDAVPHSDLRVVYIGSLNCSQGWTRILLGTPFAYNGTDNLVIAIDDNSARSHNYTFAFASSETYRPMSLVYYSNYDDIDCTSLSSLPPYVVEGAVLDHRNVFNIEICPPNGCPRPQLRMPRVRANDVTLHWNNTSDSYLVGYRLTGSDRWIEDNILTTDTFFTLTNYYFDSDYVYHVRQYCGEGVSNWSIGTFNTAEIPCLPPLGLRLLSVSNQSASFAWIPEDNNICYRLRVWNTAFDTTITTYLANGSVDGLTAATRYYAAVEVQCEYIDQPSIWSDTISFVSYFCPDATDLEALEVHGNSALIDWQCDEGPEQWLVEWGRQGFDQGTGITVQADHHPFLLTGLTGETTYDIYVRSVCSADYVSESWSNRLTITTEYSGVSEVVGADRVHLSPNPSRGDVELLLPDLPSAVSVEVVDMAGRTILTRRLPAHTERATLGTDALPQGAYFVHIVGEDLVTVKKLLRE